MIRRRIAVVDLQGTPGWTNTPTTPTPGTIGYQLPPDPGDPPPVPPAQPNWAQWILGATAVLGLLAWFKPKGKR